MTDDDELQAAELAFGLIDGSERRAAEARQARDPGFAEAVARWQAHAAAMLGARDEAPRPSLWPELAARLPANDVAPAPLARRPQRRWMFATFAASAAAVLLAVVAVERAPRPPAPLAPPVASRPAPPLVAMLTGADTNAVVAVSFDPRLRRLTLAPVALKARGHAAELWVIPPDKKPRSLGIVGPSGDWRPAPADAAGLIVAGATLAVSLEPPGGSPSGQPTGPVVLSGTIHKI